MPTAIAARRAPAPTLTARAAVLPVGVRASLSLALARGRFDVVHGFEPGLPSLSYLALRDSGALTAATFFSPERLAYPPARAQRERLLARIDALLATTPEVATAAEARFPGRYELVPQGIDPKLFAPAQKRKRVVLEWREGERPLLRALVGELEQQPGWELVLLRTRPLLEADRFAAAARTHARADGAERSGARRDPSLGRDLRPGARRLGTPPCRGADRGSGDCSPRPGAPRSRSSPPPRRGA